MDTLTRVQPDSIRIAVDATAPGRLRVSAIGPVPTWNYTDVRLEPLFDEAAIDRLTAFTFALVGNAPTGFDIEMLEEFVGNYTFPRWPPHLESITVCAATNHTQFEAVRSEAKVFEAPSVPAAA